MVDVVSETNANDSLQNPEPDSYRSFGLPRPITGRGTWEHGGKMRFVPRWVATVPNIDLRATFQCGDKIIVGSQRETACLLRDTGRVLWRVAASRAASVVTPFGLARLGFDGRVELHDLETGGVALHRRTSRRARPAAPRARSSTRPALPKLLVVAEGDRSVTAVDLVSGEVRWRYTGRRPASYRMRRAGKLLIVAGGDSALVALDVFTGEVVWRVRDRLPFSGDICIDHDSAFAVAGGPVGPASSCTSICGRGAAPLGARARRAPLHRSSAARQRQRRDRRPRATSAASAPARCSRDTARRSGSSRPVSPRPPRPGSWSTTP